jgi:hypothetical protein
MAAHDRSVSCPPADCESAWSAILRPKDLEYFSPSANEAVHQMLRNGFIVLSITPSAFVSLPLGVLSAVNLSGMTPLLKATPVRLARTWHPFSRRNRRNPRLFAKSLTTGNDRSAWLARKDSNLGVAK